MAGGVGRRLRLLALTGALGLTAACERVVDVEIADPDPRLVVAGRVELSKESPVSDQVIELSTTDGFFSNRPPPPATGAVVVVTDGTGGMFPFIEVSPGRYETSSLLPRIGETYTLSVDYDGDSYMATSQLMAVPAIDSLYFMFEEETIIVEEEGFRAAIDWVDPPGIANFYLWEQLVDGVNVIPPDPGNAFNLVARDEFFDGQAIAAFQPNDEVALQPGQTVEIRQIALSSLTHDFYRALFEQNALGSGNPFSIPPANVRGNVENLTRPDYPALGYFEAAEVSARTSVVPDR